MERDYVVSYHDQDLASAQDQDAILWKQMLSGSRESFSTIFLRYNPILLTVGLKLGFDRTMVEDCIQELFTNIWLQRENVSEVNSVKYYLVVSLRRGLFYQQEKLNRFSLLKEQYKTEALSDYAVEIKTDHSEEENAQLLSLGFKALPKRQEQALKLRYLESKSYPEIASIMAVNEDSVRRFVSKAIKKLKTIVQLPSR